MISINQCARRVAALLILSLAPAALAQAQQAAVPAIAVTGTPRPLTLTAPVLATLPRASIATTNNGITTTYEGVLLADVLKHAGVPLGPGMRSGMLASYVIAAASDGYRVVFSLGEVDPAITDGRYLVADLADGKPLFGENGTFRLVVLGDKRGARSVRMLSSLTVVQLSGPPPR